MLFDLWGSILWTINGDVAGADDDFGGTPGVGAAGLSVGDGVAANEGGVWGVGAFMSPSDKAFAWRSVEGFDDGATLGSTTSAFNSSTSFPVSSTRS